MGFPFSKQLYTFLFTSFIILLTSCSPRVSDYFDSTHYVESFNTHIINDSLDLHIKTAGDINYALNKQDLARHNKDYDHHFEHLFAYGETWVQPIYQIYLVLDPVRPIKAKNSLEIVQDTTFGNHTLVMLCRTQDADNQNGFRRDCRDFFNSISFDDQYREELPSLFNLTERVGNHYYEGLKRIQDYPVQGRGQQSFQLQMSINYASFMAPNTTYEKLLKKFPFGKPPAKDSVKKVIQTSAIQEKENVINKLLQEAKNRKLVMFSENHFYPTHRMLLQQLLPDFRSLGFKYLALEALGAQQDSLLNTGNAPTIDTGFYTRDPHYAELIRHAQKLGFTFVSYENTDSTKSREQGQADNLYAKTFGSDPSAKVLTLAGLAHIYEHPTKSGKEWLAYLLHTKYNLDPLTISQSILNSFYQMAHPLTLVSNDLFDDHRLNSVDWILLNNLPLTPSHPNYTFKNTYHQKVQVSIFLASELKGTYGFPDRISYRSGLVKPGKKVKYDLPKRDYLVVIYDKKGEVLNKKKLSANELSKS